MKKKRVLIVTIFSALCFLCGCVIWHTAEKNSTAPAQSLSHIEEKNSTAPVQSPPHCLDFRSIEEYQAFFLAEELSDAAFQEYIEDRDFNMNGIQNKEDLAEIKSKLESVPFPVVEGAHLTYVDILPEYDQLYVCYELNGDDACTFLFDYTDLIQAKKTVEAEQNIQRWNEASFDDLWYDNSKDVYELLENSSGCTMRFRYYGSEIDACATIEKNTVFISSVQE